MQEMPRTMTEPHRQLIQLLEGLDLTVEVEVSFPPKSVDCYLPDLHVAFEADGPQHSGPKDRKRDDYLMATYALPTYRLTSADLRSPESWKILCRRLLTGVWLESVVERRMIARRAGAELDGGSTR